MPTMTKARKSAGAAKRLSLVVSVPKKPMMKDPRILMRMVPQGNCAPAMRATASASQARAMLPSAPPMPIQM